jgi:hypothetical protein
MWEVEASKAKVTPTLLPPFFEKQYLSAFLPSLEIVSLLPVCYPLRGHWARQWETKPGYAEYLLDTLICRRRKEEAVPIEFQNLQGM